jgi:hypothetical protein
VHFDSAGFSSENRDFEVLLAGYTGVGNVDESGGDSPFLGGYEMEGTARFLLDAVSGEGLDVLFIVLVIQLLLESKLVRFS